MGTWSGSSYLSGATGSVQLIETASATFYITGIQLEVGDTETPFEHRSFGEELALCQRYYWDNVGQNVYIAFKARESDRQRIAQMPHPVPMRAVPTITKVTDASNYTTTFTQGSTLASRASGTAPTDGTTAGGGTAKFDAEL